MGLLCVFCRVVEPKPLIRMLAKLSFLKLYLCFCWHCTQHQFLLRKTSFFIDHCLVKVTIGENQIHNAKFYWLLWMLNTSLLKHKTFDTVDYPLRKTAEQNETRPLRRWEWFKEEVKMSVIQRSSTLKFHALAEERKLQQDLRTLCEPDC